MHIKNILKWLSKISDPFASKLKVSNWWHFYIFLTGPHTFIACTSWNNQKNLVILDAIKASVPKFLNFLGAELNSKWITHFEGKPFFWLEKLIGIKFPKKSFIYQKTDFRYLIELCKKIYFCPEENTKPFDRNYATINT